MPHSKHPLSPPHPKTGLVITSLLLLPSPSASSGPSQCHQLIPPQSDLTAGPPGPLPLPPAVPSRGYPSTPASGHSRSVHSQSQCRPLTYIHHHRFQPLLSFHHDLSELQHLTGPPCNPLLFADISLVRENAHMGPCCFSTYQQPHVGRKISDQTMMGYV